MTQEKINIAELLKDCPKGMELYSPIFGAVYLEKIRPHLSIVVATDKEQGDFKEEFLYDGRYGMNGECMLFPSKSKTTWEGFLPPCRFKDGDIVITTLGNIAIIRKHVGEESFCIYGLMVDNNFYKNEVTKVCVKRLATEEEKQKLFDAIKANGYKWNAKTKTLEKLTEQKFDITTLKPFDKVLVRDFGCHSWSISFFSHCNELKYYKYICISGTYSQCIPYEGNEHLFGTTDECDEFYKTWE